MYTVIINKAFLLASFNDLSGEDFKNLKTFLIQLSPQVMCITDINQEELDSNDELNLLHQELMQYFKPSKTNWACSEVDILNQMMGTGVCVAFLNGKTFKPEIMVNQFGIEMINTENYKERWQHNLKYWQEEKVLRLSTISSKNALKYWNQVSFIANTPFNSIIIIDRYLLKKTKSKDISTNVIPLLKALISSKYVGKLDILILAEVFGEWPRKEASMEFLENELRIILDTLSEFFKPFKRIKPQIILARFNKQFYPEGSNFSIHDRVVYTNYFTLMVTSGFDIFDNSGNRKVIPKGRLIITSMLNAEEVEDTKSSFSVYRAYFKHLRIKSKENNMFGSTSDIENRLLGMI